MCGIAGHIGRNPPSPERVTATLAKMRNRGPDFRDSRSFASDGVTVTMLHSRLSIIDLDPRSHQPFTIDGRVIVFNGEIYNYVELAEELKNDGVSLLTSSDTEVLLRCHLKHGDKCAEKLEGMWSFAIYDPVKGEVFISRDRFGEKPLWLFSDGKELYFGSEVKFIEELAGRKFTPNKRQTLRYLVNGYKSLYKKDETFFDEIKELPSGSNLTVSLRDLSRRQWRHWTPVFTEKESMSLEEAVEGAREKFLNSVKLRLRADVPMAFCLSGGVDSSAIISAAVKHFKYEAAAFSIIDSDERYNEEDNIDATIKDLGCPCTKIRISTDGVLKRLENLVAYHDMPVSTISYLVHSMLSEAISEDGYRIAVSGTAADELFTGYYDHYNLHLHMARGTPDHHARLDEWRKHVAPNVRNPYLQKHDLYLEDENFREHIYLGSEEFEEYLKEPFHEEFTEEKYCGILLKNRMLNELMHEAVPVILREDDLNSMLYSVENRSPYLDSELFKFAYSIPARHLIRDGYNKYILREAVKGILNDKVRLDRRKKGFNASINSLVDFNDPATRAYLLNDSPVFEIVDREKIAKAMEIKPMPNSLSKFMFYFINVKMFLEQRGRAL